MENEKTIGLVVPHTHWDREWRYPIWQNRLMLQDFMDELISILEKDPGYSCFICDGQSVIIEDYLQVRPGNKDRVKDLVKKGKLKIGPWFTLPDLYPVDGESLVRNLLKGSRVCKKYGGRLEMGYTSFGWGQTAQMPQIYAGFGIDFIITAKYLSPQRCPESEFIWESPDGTKVLTTKLGLGTRHNLFVNGYISVMHGVHNSSPDYKLDWTKAGMVVHNADDEKHLMDHFKMETNIRIHPEVIPEAFKKVWDNTDITLMKDHRLFMAGCDFTGPLPKLPELLEEVNKAFPDRELRMSTLEEYSSLLKRESSKLPLRTIKGELRDAPSLECTGNALQTRSANKRLNKKVQNSLYYKAEPYSVFSAWVGAEYRKDLLYLSLDYLLKSHAHDSINGVTQDKTADDVTYRLAQALELSEVVTDQACAEIIKRIDMKNCKPTDVMLVVFNPLPFERREVLKAWIDFPAEQKVWDFEIQGPDGFKNDLQHVSRKEELVPVHDLDSRPWPFTVFRHCVHFDTGEIPACGYKVFKAVPGTRFNDLNMNPSAQRTSQGDELCRESGVLENKWLKVDVNPDGSVNLLDKKTGHLYKNMNYFEDTGENGDYWTTYPPYENRTYYSFGQQAAIWLEENGPLSATIVTEIVMKLPARTERPVMGIKGESRRVEEKNDVRITSRYTLKRDSKRLDVSVKIDNTVEDHRLRVLFDTGIKAEFADAAGHFTVDRRTVKPVRNAPDGGYYPEMQTLPQQDFVDISDGHQGLALINDCLSEYEAMDNASGTVALTLLRSVRNAVCTEMRVWAKFPDQKGGQALGLHEFHYALLPHAGRWNEADVYPESLDFNVSLKPVQSTPHTRGDLPWTMGFFSVKPSGLVLTALKKTEDRDSWIVRLFNPQETMVDSEISCFGKTVEAWLVDLDENRLNKLDPKAEILKLPVPSQKIVTIELVLEVRK